jgi:hypothetical protein
MAEERVALVGRVAMTVIGPDGTVRAEVEGHNRVLRLGRGLAAQALAGQAAPPVFTILLGADGTVSQDDDLKGMLKPIPETAYSIDTGVPVPAVDPGSALFKLASTFTARADMMVAESGIAVGQVISDAPQAIAPAETTAPIRRTTALKTGALTASLTTAVGSIRPLATPEPVLYNRAVINPAVTLRQGDKLTVTWTVSFVSA